MRTLILASLCVSSAAFVISGCSGGEPLTKGDATPPANYHPYYVHQTTPVPANPQKLSNGAVLQISRFDVTDPQTVRMYTHIVDSTGNYFSGAASGAWKPLWCGVLDRTDGDSSAVGEFTVREITENNNETYAIAFVMDHSGSMGDARARAVQEAAEAFIKMKRPEDAVTIVKYDNRTAVEVPLTTNATELLAKLRKDGLSGYGGSTAILNGIQAAIDQLSTAKGFTRKVVLVFTDGQDNSSTNIRDSIIHRTLRSGTIICGIDFGEGIAPDYLSSLARASGGSYHHMYGTHEFGRVFEDIYKRLRNYYVVEFVPRDFGKHTTRVKFCAPSDTMVSQEIAYDNTPDIGAISLLDVTFDLNKADLKPESKKALLRISVMMRAFPAMVIEVRGHTDSANKTGDVDYNMKLSQRRADAVCTALGKLGVQAERMHSKGFGDTQPVAENATEIGRARNRRTEFLIISK